MMNRHTREKIAGELIKMAKNLTAKAGYDVTVKGGNRGLMIYISDDRSFPSYDIKDIARMMSNFKNDATDIISSLPFEAKSLEDARMNSQGKNNTSVALQTSYYVKVRSDKQAARAVDVLKNNRKIGNLNNWTDY
jgi:hypothetical protein